MSDAQEVDYATDETLDRAMFNHISSSTADRHARNMFARLQAHGDQPPPDDLCWKTPLFQRLVWAEALGRGQELQRLRDVELQARRFVDNFHNLKYVLEESGG